MARLRAREFAVRALFLEAHNAFMDAGTVVEDVEERLARVGEVAVDVGRGHQVTRLVCEERLPVIQLPPVEQIGLVKQDALHPVLEEQRVELALAGYARYSWMRRSHSFQTHLHLSLTQSARRMIGKRSG